MADTHPDLSELHDARLVSLELDWCTGDVRLSLQLDDGSSRIPMAGSPTTSHANPAGPATLTVREAIDVRLSRAFEWGPSDYVDSATWTPSEAGDSGALRLQMQSGDVFAIRGRTMERR